MISRSCTAEQGKHDERTLGYVYSSIYCCHFQPVPLLLYFRLIFYLKKCLLLKVKKKQKKTRKKNGDLGQYFRQLCLDAFHCFENCHAAKSSWIAAGILTTTTSRLTSSAYYFVSDVALQINITLPATLLIAYQNNAGCGAPFSSRSRVEQQLSTAQAIHLNLVTKQELF